ncbi:NAD(P)/FAD-dependent oxidoreductase [Denitratisoma oestradiolicum]|uniref:Rubredoxin-NAD(+) reductase n=1 Tax=Denitratisoma oestradiolicum TaxID=311182 RepID=A0A6S6Y415_9PROT|nr:FAD-dependent oxidoreductase [Denitratisoma oestradiolicum]TWO80881.1 FAD-dependent oxidoreductase [Denitratisoma oestradiolicum]CAB1367358.1 Rubredoxin-NAD(+) reductase [Denitratisoma oestradiolicum]
MNTPVLILGAGQAAITLARELRKLDAGLPLMLVTADGGGFYSKPSLSNALLLKRDPEQLLQTPREVLAGQLKAEIHAGVKVHAIDAAAHRIDTTAGSLDYGRLVLAVGAHPIRLPLAGDGADDVLSVNHLDDYTVFRQRLEGARRVVILGAGLIGCEFANDIVATGRQVTVLDLAPQALGRLLPPKSADFFRRRLETAGIVFHFGISAARVDKVPGSYRITDNTGAEVEADLVVSAVGLKPAVELAQSAGLAVNRGIQVNTLLASSAADIYALGDCAEVQGLVLPFVLPIMQQARALAKTLAGNPTAVTYPAMPVVVKTPACPTVVCPPPAGAEGTWQEEVGAEGVTARYQDAQGRLLGFALLGDTVSARQTLAAQVPAWI